MSVLRNLSRQLHDYKEYAFTPEQHLALGLEFLNLPLDSNQIDPNEVLDMVDGEPLFNSWLWFDHSFDGKTFLEKFMEEYPSIPTPEKAELKKLFTTAIFSFFEIDYSEPGHIEITDLRTGEEYTLNEQAAATHLHPGQVILARIAQQANHWELMMPTGSFTPVTIDQKLKDTLIEQAKETTLTMKDSPSYQSLRSDLGLEKTDNTDSSEPTPAPMTKAEARDKLTEAINNTDLRHYTSATNLANIIDRSYQESRSNPSKHPETPLFVKIIGGLASSIDLNIQDNVKIQQAATNYHNSLGPSHHATQRKLEGKSPDILSFAFDPLFWIDEEAECLRLINDDPDKAFEAYERLFKKLLEQEAVTASLYRILANAGVSLLAVGRFGAGILLLEEALKLKTDYQFAKKQIKRVRDGEMDEIIDRDIEDGILQKDHDPYDELSVEDLIDHSPILDYLDWFRSLNIKIKRGDNQEQ